MNFQQRPFNGDADKLAMAALAQAAPDSNLHTVDLPYRFSSWALDDPGNACLWVDQTGRLVGWAVLQAPWWMFDYACLPEAEAGLHPQVLAWAGQRARQLSGTPHGRPSWFVVAFKEQAARIRDLEAAGFACQADVGEDSWSKVQLCRPAALPVAHYRIPEGFVVRSLAGEGEAQAYVDLHRAVFETKTMTLEWRQRTLRHPAYRPDLDVVVAAPDGRLAAFCIGWQQGDNGHIEPLGCHADFRHYALGRVALAEALRRLQASGVENIYVETDGYRDTAFRLYQSMGFSLLRDVLIYRKDYETSG